MFYSIFPILIILLALAGIIVIIVRKFPQLAALQVEKMEEVKQAKVKDKIKKQRFERGLKKLGDKTKSVFGKLEFAVDVWKKVQQNFRVKVRRIQDRYQKTLITEIKNAKREERKPEETVALTTLLTQADEASARGDLSLAETKYIEIIKRDERNVEAYRGLGKVYYDMRKYKEARELFEFLLKLSPQDAKAFNRLGMIATDADNWEEAARCFEEAVKIEPGLAIRYFDLGRAYMGLEKPAAALRNFAKAVEIEPSNPKYLDHLLEMSMATGDIDLAKETYERLRLVNAENQKLAEFQQRIRNLEAVEM